MALLSFRGISTPSLPAQGEQHRFSYFNIQRGNPDFAYRVPLNASGQFCGAALLFGYAMDGDNIQRGNPAKDKRSIKLRRKRAGWDPNYLAEILGHLTR
jgi:hypothetical protein